MQVEVRVKRMETKFGGCDFSGFRVMARFSLAFKMAKTSLRTMDYSPWSSKDLIDWNQLKNFMQVRIDELCMCTNFGGRDLFSSGDIATLKNGQISLSDHGL